MHQCASDRRFHFFFFFNAPPPTEIYTLSLHDALPISSPSSPCRPQWWRSSPNPPGFTRERRPPSRRQDRKSTRLNSSHSSISYAVFCLKKKTDAQRGRMVAHVAYHPHWACYGTRPGLY